MNSQHLSELQLSNLIQEDVSPDEQRVMQKHLLACSNCQKDFQDMKKIMSHIGNKGSWATRKKTNFYYSENSQGGLMTEPENAPTITEDYLDNQETIGDQIQEQIKKAPWWLLSFVLNGILLLLTTMIMIAQTKEKKSKNIIQAELPKPQELEYDPEVKKELVEEKKEIPKTDPKITEKSEVQVPENVEVSDHMEADTESDFSEMAEADADNQLLSDQSGDIGKFSGLGAGGGSGGAFGSRGRGGRKWAVIKGGGSTKTESAMKAALEWLKRHQFDDGTWRHDQFTKNCGIDDRFPGKCSGESPKFDQLAFMAGKDYRKKEGNYNAMTGLSILAFTGAGYSHKRGKYKKSLKKSLKLIQEKYAKWKDNQSLKGKIASTQVSYTYGYTSSPLVLAAIELYGVSRDAYLKPMCQDMVDFMWTQWNNGWMGSNSGDFSGCGFPLMVVRDAKHVGLKQSKANIKKATDLVKARTDSVGGGQYSAIYLGNSIKDNAALDAILTFSYSMLSKKKKDDAVIKGLVKHMLTNRQGNDRYIGWDYKKDPVMGRQSDSGIIYDRWYFWYYGTFAMFQYGSKEQWKKWNDSMSKMLVEKQGKYKDLDAKSKCEDGSWFMARDNGVVQYGRQYHTAIGALILQVYYRYKHVSEKK